MRLAFLGSPDAAVPTMAALHAAGHEIALVVSGPDRRRGRGARRSPTAVKAAAQELGIEVTDDLSEVTRVGAELGVVVAYGRIIPNGVLDVVPMVNLHFSLLPRWRGAAPVERAILAGDTRTGVCVMDVAEGLDTGDVHASAEVPLDDEVTAADLTGRLAELGAMLVVDALAEGLTAGRPQDPDGATYAAKITTEDRHIDWNDGAEQVRRTVRIGGAWTTFRGTRLKVLRTSAALPAEMAAPVGPGIVDGDLVGCGGGTVVRLDLVQPEGRGVMDVAAWINGARPGGERLGGDREPGPDG